jgi:hypothetical protein
MIRYFYHKAETVTFFIIRKGLSKTTFLKTLHTEGNLKQIVWGAVFGSFQKNKTLKTELSKCQTMKKEVSSN